MCCFIGGRGAGVQKGCEGCLFDIGLDVNGKKTFIFFK